MVISVFFYLKPMTSRLPRLCDTRDNTIVLCRQTRLARNKKSSSRPVRRFIVLAAQSKERTQHICNMKDKQNKKRNPPVEERSYGGNSIYLQTASHISTPPHDRARCKMKFDTTETARNLPKGATAIPRNCCFVMPLLAAFMLTSRPSDLFSPFHLGILHCVRFS